jgi:hypothetical protein
MIANTCVSWISWLKIIRKLKIVLTVKQKLELLEKFGNGESVTEIAKDYG